MFMGFTLHIYIIFVNNLLTGGPAWIAVFCAYSSVLKERNIKRSPNRMKPSATIFLEQTQSRRLGVDVKEATRRPRGREARPGGWARPPISWHPRTFPGLNSKSLGSYPFQKSHSRRFHFVWTPLDIPFLWNTETGNKTTIWAGPLVSRLVPKVIYKCIIKPINLQNR